jgi:hypothetical protein
MLEKPSPSQCVNLRKLCNYSELELVRSSSPEICAGYPKPGLLCFALGGPPLGVEQHRQVEKYAMTLAETFAKTGNSVRQSIP